MRLTSLYFLALAFVGCAAGAVSSTERSLDEILALLRGDNQAKINELTVSVLDGDTDVLVSWLEESSPTSIYLPIDGITDLEGRTHYQVNSVSQYFLCLLEVREGEATLEILAREQPALVQLMRDNDCGICCGGVIDIPVIVEAALRDFWAKKLASDQ